MKKIISLFLVMTVCFAFIPVTVFAGDKGASDKAYEHASDQSIFNRTSDWFATIGKSSEEKKEIKAERQAKRAAKRAEKEKKKAGREAKKTDKKAKHKMKKGEKKVKKEAKRAKHEAKMASKKHLD